MDNEEAVLFVARELSFSLGSFLPVPNLLGGVHGKVINIESFSGPLQAVPSLLSGLYSTLKAPFSRHECPSFSLKELCIDSRKKGRLFRKGWRDNENKKSEKLFRFHYEHSTPILSNCLYMFCRIMQPCCNMFLVLLFEMGLVSVHTGGGGDCESKTWCRTVARAFTARSR